MNELGVKAAMVYDSKHPSSRRGETTGLSKCNRKELRHQNHQELIAGSAWSRLEPRNIIERQKESNGAEDGIWNLAQNHG
jgi:hypothetical protein